MEQAPCHYKCLKDKYFPFSESSKGVPMTFIYSTYNILWKNPNELFGQPNILDYCAKCFTYNPY